MANEVYPFFRKVLEKICRLFALIFRINHKNLGNILDRTVKAERKQVLQNWKLIW